MDERIEAGTRSRRALLAGLLGGVGAWALGAVDRVAPAEAAAGDPVRLSRTNRAGSSDTVLQADTTGTGLRVSQAGTGTAIRAESTGGTGGLLSTAKRGRFGLIARNTAATQGDGGAIRAEGGQNAAIEAVAERAVGSAVSVINSSPDSDASGVYGESVAGAGVFAAATSASAPNFGVYSYTNSSQGTGVLGYAASASGMTTGVHGFAASGGGTGVHGEASSTGTGVWGETKGGFGVLGTSEAGNGVRGESSTFTGTVGVSAIGAGLAGGSDTNVGVSAYSGSDWAVYATSGAGKAARFDGNVQVSGVLSKGGGSFRIDHPLDPERKYLQHSFVESPDMLNVYTGIAELDAGGGATIELPDWFAALNRDCRYALTAIGRAMPELHVAREMDRGRFQVAGGAPGARVSWLVTGIRQDAWANANRIAVEVDKTGDERGRYLHPEAYGRPVANGEEDGLRRAARRAVRRAGKG